MPDPRGLEGGPRPGAFSTVTGPTGREPEEQRDWVPGRRGPAGQLQGPLLPQLPGLTGNPRPSVWSGKAGLAFHRLQALRSIREAVQGVCRSASSPTAGLSHRACGVSGSVCTDAHLPHTRAVRCQFEQRSRDVTGMGRAQPGGVR